MKNKILKWTFWSGLGLTAASLISSLSLVAMSPSAKTSNLTPPPQDSLNLGSKKLNSTNKLNQISVSISSPYLKIDGTTVIGLTSQGLQQTKIKVPDGITEIGNSAFRYDNNVKKITLPDGLVRIGQSAFAECGNLIEVNIPSSVNYIEDFVFENSSSLTKITIPENLKMMGKNVLFGTKLTTNQVTNNSGVLFDWWIKNHAYSDHGGKTIWGVIDNGGTVELNTFKNNLEKPFTVIGKNAFDQQFNLITLTIPEGFRSIGDFSFSGCSNMNHFSIPKSVTYIGLTPLEGCSPRLVVNNYSRVLFNWWVVHHIIVASNTDLNQFYNSNHETFNRLGVGSFRAYSNLVEIKLCADTVTIGDAVFKSCTSLSSIDIPDSVTEIGANAFANSGLKNVRIAANSAPLIIGTGAFINCTNLTKFELKRGVVFKARLERIFSSPLPDFYVIDNTILERLLIAGVDRAKIHLLGKISGDFIVDDIDSSSIIGLSDQGKAEKTTITIPENITNIRNFAFVNCSASLEAISFDHSNKFPKIEECAFKNVPESTQFKIKKELFADKLVSAHVSKDKIIIVDAPYEINLNGILIKVTIDTQTTRLLLPGTIGDTSLKGINSGAFKNCFQLTEIEFNQNVKLDKSKISSSSFDGLGSDVKYLVHSYDNGNALKGKVGNDEQIIVKGDDLTFTEDGTLKKINNTPTFPDKNTWLIPQFINTIADDAFTNFAKTSSKLRYIEFSDGIGIAPGEANWMHSLDNIQCTRYIVHNEDLYNHLTHHCGKDSSVCYDGKHGTYVVNAEKNQLQKIKVWKEGQSELNIPKVIYGTTIESIGSDILEGALFADQIKTVIIPESVNTIDATSFQSCKNLQTIIFNNCSLTVNGEKFPLKQVAYRVYSKAVGDSLSDHVQAQDQDKIIVVGKDCEISYSGILTRVINLTDSTYTISTKINKVDVKAIGSNAFVDCQNLVNLTEIKFEKDTAVEQINDRAFAKCKNLKTIEIPASVTTIGAKVFDGCDKLDQINFAKGTKLNHIDLNTLTNLNNTKCFFDIDDLKTARTYLQDHGFDERIIFKTKEYQVSLAGSFVKLTDQNKTDFTIPSSIGSTGNSSETIFIDDVGFRAFESCPNLKTVKFPCTINTVGDEIFYKCPNLTKLTFDSGTFLRNVSPSTFYGVSNTAQYVFSPKDLAAAQNLHGNVPNDDQIILDGDNFAISINGKIVKAKKPSQTFEMPSIDAQTHLTITGIEKDAFSKWSSTQKFIFEGDITKLDIEKGAFNNCQNAIYCLDKADYARQLIDSGISDQQIYAIKNQYFYINNQGNLGGLTKDAQTQNSLTIPQDTKLILVFAFSDATNLKHLIFDGAMDQLDIQSSTFSKCPELIYCLDQNNLALKDKLIASQSGIEVQQIYTIDPSKNFYVNQTGLLGYLTHQGLLSKVLVLDDSIKKINSLAFADANNLAQIIFHTSKDLVIDQNAFSQDPKLLYLIDDSSLTQKLIDAQSKLNRENIFVQHDDFYLNNKAKLGGVSLQGQSKDTLTIGNDVKEIIPYAFSNDTNLKTLIFDVNGANLVVNHDLVAKDSAIVCLVNDEITSEKLIDAKSGVAINNIFIKTGDFYINNQHKFGYLTQQGKTKQTLSLANNIAVIGNDAFRGCSNSLNKITIHHDKIILEDGAFKSIPKNILNKIQFYVYSVNARDALAERGISISHIHVLGHISMMTIGIITASVIVAMLLLGLGIGLPMRKQHKINVLNSKLTHKRIDKLSAANAMAFKKVVEATGTIKSEIVKLSSDVKALKAASPKWVNKKAKSSINSPKASPAKASVKPTTIKKIISAKPLTKKS